MKPRFISDIHLSEDSPHLTNAFKTFLNESKESCTHLFILGDLFEIWIGDDDDSAFNQEIKKILTDFTSDGPETFFMHGNRDFLVGEAFAKETGITILPDPFNLEINNQKVILSHGDFLCTDDKDYIDFKKQVRDKDWQNNFLKKTINERKQIAATLRTDSKEATLKKSDEITDVNNQSVEDFINEHQPDLFIHGHTHRPNIHDVGVSKRIVLGDWGEQGWLLSINDKEFNLIKFNII
tara:strand:- start:666 stop:1379 length:714 start_codon:yes stop_codon:yes gene_type:complete